MKISAIAVAPTAKNRPLPAGTLTQRRAAIGRPGGRPSFDGLSLGVREDACLSAGCGRRGQGKTARPLRFIALDLLHCPRTRPPQSRRTPPPRRRRRGRVLHTADAFDLKSQHSPNSSECTRFVPRLFTPRPSSGPGRRQEARRRAGAGAQPAASGAAAGGREPGRTATGNREFESSNRASETAEQGSRNRAYPINADTRYI